MSFRRSIFWTRSRHRCPRVASQSPASLSRCATRRAPSSLPLATVGKDALDEGEQSACPTQQMECSIAVLNVGGMNDNVQQETQRVDQDVPLATFDLLARVVARRIEPSPPFCVPFAVFESIIATVGLASRPSCSRTAT